MSDGVLLSYSKIDRIGTLRSNDDETFLVPRDGWAANFKPTIGAKVSFTIEESTFCERTIRYARGVQPFVPDDTPPILLYQM